MGVRLKVCAACGIRKMIGRTKSRCKACRVRNRPIMEQHELRIHRRKKGRKRRGVKQHCAAKINRFVPYAEYLVSDWWKERRERKLRSVKYECQRCINMATEVHHKHYDSLWREADKDLEALCRPCHEAIHQATIAANDHLRAIAMEN